MNDFFDNKAAGTSDVNKQAHANSDVDESPDSLHHTLGGSSFQAARGNHSHYFPGANQGSLDTTLPSLLLPDDGVTYDVYDFTDITVAKQGLTKAAVAVITVFFNARATAAGNSACNWYLICNGVQVDFHRNHNQGDQYMSMGATLTGSVAVTTIDTMAIVVRGANDAASAAPILCTPAHINVSYT